jgi:hypothetical protein
MGVERMMAMDKNNKQVMPQPLALLEAEFMRDVRGVS